TAGEAANAAYGFAMQAQNPDSDKLVDTTIGVIAVAYPPAGIVLGFAAGLVRSGREASDPVGDAIRLINTRLDQLTGRVDELDRQIVAVQDFAFKQANINRMRELKDRRERLQVLIGKMAARPTDQAGKDEIAREAQLLVNRYLDQADEERDLWTWNDRLRVYSDPQHPGKLTGKLLPAAFKPVPTLEFYAATLAFFMTAIEYQANGRRQWLIDTYGKDLLRHASLLSVRPYWRELDEPPANDHLPEWLMTGVTCDVGPVSKYGANGQCSWASYCTDQFALKYRVPIANGSFQAPAASNALCTWNVREPPRVDDARRDAARQPANLVYGTAALATVETRYDVSDEEDLQQNWGLGAMTILADEVARLARYGTVREQYVGRFDMTTWKKQFLYAVNPLGELVWQADLVGEDRNPPPARAPGASERVSASGHIAAAGAGAPASPPSAPSSTSSPSSPSTGSRAAGSGATLVAAERRANASTALLPQAPPAKWLHQWEGPRTVNSGWQNFVDVFPAGYGPTGGTAYGFSLFGLTRDGTLKWVRHDGFADGSAKWSAPVDVGSGWNSFKKVFAGGDGVLYAIGGDGKLRWYRYQDVLHAKRPPSWAGPLVVASGWGGVVDAFSGGAGVIYAVQKDGTLLWWRHVSYQNGIDPARTPAPGFTGLGRVGAKWEGPKVVGSGWQNFRKIFSPGDGFIYAVNGAGELFWYYHKGYQDGANSWQGPVKISSDWGSHRVAFSLMWGAPQATAGVR
ncbi:MAG: hypothetical protein JWP59_2979, partial [Massilia sp.]|nr:hypothetical protein [Massilia sp.]